jgi:hypothetical protein
VDPCADIKPFTFDLVDIIAEMLFSEFWNSLAYFLEYCDSGRAV